MGSHLGSNTELFVTEGSGPRLIFFAGVMRDHRWEAAFEEDGPVQILNEQFSLSSFLGDGCGLLLSSCIPVSLSSWFTLREACVAACQLQFFGSGAGVFSSLGAYSLEVTGSSGT